MSECETCEISLSALIDGELPPEELLPTLDHLTECPSCRAFYRDLRALASALPMDAGRAALSETSREAPEEIWQRIELAAAPALVRTKRVQPWAMRLAAAILLVASLWGALALVRLAHPAGEPIEVTLGEDRGRMTEKRFVDLTVELLRSDPRYHHEMLQVLNVVLEQSERQETPVDYDAPRPERRDADRRSAKGTRRLS